jgi:hypothetical protein
MFTHRVVEELCSYFGYFYTENIIIMCTGGVSYALFISLYISKLLCSVPFLYLYKVLIFRAHPFQWPSKGIGPHQNHVQNIINNRYINSYWLSGSAPYSCSGGHEFESPAGQNLAS